MSEYDIEVATDNPPTFEFEEGDKEEQEYVLAYLIPLQLFYDDYKHKSVDYVIENVEKDTKKLEKEFLKNNKKLDSFFKETKKETLLENGVVTGKVKEVEIETDTLHDLVNEQKSTILAITGALGLGLLSSAYNARYRNTQDNFNIDSNIRGAVNRTLQTATYGFGISKSLAQDKVLQFLYDDPMMEWVSEDDGDVCKFCREIEYSSPMPLSEMPLTPLHPHCRCHRKLYGKEDSYTAKALNLMFY